MVARREKVRLKERGDNLFPEDIWKIDGKSEWQRLFLKKRAFPRCQVVWESICLKMGGQRTTCVKLLLN